ncbi:MAG: hypothetical protein QOJ59_1876 [Thermomicrobiales bacterium]|nr:hypothetical protein [Thermomicrobiales bacterium]
MIAAQGGIVYKVVGDAFQAAFETAADALAAAVSAQIALRVELWPVAEPILVRMALHTCDVQPQPDGDYRDSGLNRLGRLLAAGHGGQILLTPVVVELVRQALPQRLTIRNLGEHRLKDLQPERIYQVVQPDLPDTFLPLRDASRFIHDLPYLPTSLIGRGHETAEVRALLREEGARLVTLTGPGGTGKTRLAIHAAAGLLEVFDDGVFLVDLAALQDPALVPSAIARALGVREEPERSGRCGKARWTTPRRSSRPGRSSFLRTVPSWR